MTVLDLYILGKKELKNKNDMILLFKLIFGFDGFEAWLNSVIKVTNQ